MRALTTRRLAAGLALSLALAGSAAPAAADAELGKAAPSFTGAELDGRAIILDDYKAKKNVVIVFYVGHR